MTNKTLTLGSLFDGSGGFPLGGLLAGITPVWASEIEPFPIRVTTKRLPFMKHYGNISAMDGGKIEPVDIITFGSPCQDMSVAGRRDGLDGKRSSLFYEAVRIIKEMRCATGGSYPRYIVWENVIYVLKCINDVMSCTSELLKLRMCDVNLKENVFTILDTKFHKNRLVPFSDTVAESLTQYLEMSPPKSTDSLLFPSLNPRSNGGRYGNSWLQAQFRQLLRTAGIPYNGSGKGPRPHDIRHTFAVHCLNNWVLSGEDLTAALPVLSRYLGHNGLTGTQKYLQLTAQMYPDIVAKLEVQFGGLIPQMEVSNESI